MAWHVKVGMAEDPGVAVPSAPPLTGTAGRSPRRLRSGIVLLLGVRGAAPRGAPERVQPASPRPAMPSARTGM
jgi:hypothetical protein